MVHYYLAEGALDLLKLGGSLITDKDRAHTPRPEVTARLADEIAQARRVDPGLQLVIGHGSGSFGHIPARKHGTRQGVHTAEEWMGFAEVWREARALNLIVTEALLQAGLPVIVFPPSACVSANNGQIEHWNLAPLQAALAAGLVPLVFGDVIFDRFRGGTILSTEDLFEHLAHQLHPRRILLAGIENGVWADFPERRQLLPTISPENITEVRLKLFGSASPDVTGGMLQKVESMLGLVQTHPSLEIQIFSGLLPNGLKNCLLGSTSGTTIREKG